VEDFKIAVEDLREGARRMGDFLAGSGGDRP